MSDKKKQMQHSGISEPILIEKELDVLDATICIKARLENIFVIIAVVVGFLLVFLTPPLAVPDENAHFINAYAVSRLDFFANVENGQVGIRMPQAVADFINSNLEKFSLPRESKQTFTKYYFDSWLMVDMGPQTFYATSMRTINPVGYLVSGIGMMIGGLLCQSFALPYNLLLFGRIFNLMFYIAVIYYSIKLTPCFKRTMLMLSLMPMSIFLAASLSYDAILIPVSFLLFAYSARILKTDDSYVITKKEILIILFIAFFLGGIKLAYLPFMLVLLAIPRKKFGSLKRYVLCIAAVGFVAIVAYFVPALINQMKLSGIIMESEKYVAQQKYYLASHLGQIPSIIAHTFIRWRVFYLTGFFGILGWLDTNFPVPILVSFYIVLAGVLLIDMIELERFPWRAKVLSFAGSIISLCGILYMMYIGWTSLPGVVGVGADYVSGIQGRYFIPMVLFVFVLFGCGIATRLSKLRRLRINNTATSIAIMTTVLCGLFTVASVCLRFW